MFRTNVQTRHDAHIALFALHSRLHPGEQATIDLEDCDKVLRVESHLSTRDDIVSVIEHSGFQCTELEDTIPAFAPGGFML